jgi:hypothetical protein
MALTSKNVNYERHGRGRLFLVARPTADPGSDHVTRVHGYKALVYAAGDTGVALKNGVLEYANLTAEGFSIKSKQNVVEVDPNNGSKHPIGITDTEIDLEFEFLDVDPAHVADMFSLTAAELVAVAAASGKAGRKFALVGGQSILNQVVACYQLPSLIAGQFDNYLFPRVVLYGDADIKLSKGNAISMKVKGKAIPDTYLVNADGFGECMVVDVADAAALA